MRGVEQEDCDSNNDRREGSVCNGSESQEEGEGAEEIFEGILRSSDPRKGKGRMRKRFNFVAEFVSLRSVTTSKGTR